MNDSLSKSPQPQRNESCSPSACPEVVGAATWHRVARARPGPGSPHPPSYWTTPAWEVGFGSGLSPAQGSTRRGWKERLMRRGTNSRNMKGWETLPATPPPPPHHPPPQHHSHRPCYPLCCSSYSAKRLERNKSGNPPCPPRRETGER